MAWRLAEATDAPTRPRRRPARAPASGTGETSKSRRSRPAPDSGQTSRRLLVLVRSVELPSQLLLDLGPVGPAAGVEPVADGAQDRPPGVFAQHDRPGLRVALGRPRRLEPE